MKINDNPLTLNASAKIEARVHSLLFLVNGIGAADFSAFKTAFASTSVEIMKNSPSGQQQINPEILLIDLLEINAGSNGGMLVTSAGGNTTVGATVVLSDAGALDLFGEEDFKISFKGIPAGCSIDLHSIDHQTDAGSIHNIYEYVYCNAATPKSFVVNSTRHLALPVSAFSRVELQFSNGRLIQYEAAEVKAICREYNEVCAVDNGSLITGSDRWYVLDVAGAVTAKVTLTSSTNVVKVDYKNI